MPIPEQQPDGAPLPSALEAIVRRRTARRFAPDRPLPDSVLRRLLLLAAHAPSYRELQPWRFLLVRSDRNRRRLRACTFGEGRIAEAPAVLIVLGYQDPDRTDLEAILERQLALGLVTPEECRAIRAQAPRALERMEGGRPAWAARTALMAAATLMIAAEGLGMASALIEEFDPDRLRQTFGIPDDHAIGGLVALGLAAEPEPFPARLGLDRVCYQEHFGQPWTLGEPEP